MPSPLHAPDLTENPFKKNGPRATRSCSGTTCPCSIDNKKPGLIIGGRVLLFKVWVKKLTAATAIMTDNLIVIFGLNSFGRKSDPVDPAPEILYQVAIRA